MREREASAVWHPLLPFAGAATAGGITIASQVARRGDRLRIAWRLAGELRRIQLPPPAATPARRDGLWQTTCFEAFVAVATAGRYLEINRAPSGDWNVYRFDDYRLGMRAEEPIAVTCSDPVADDGERDFAFEFDLPPDFAAEQLRIGLSAVVLPRDGAAGYFALRHPGDKPDFHHRDGFAIDCP